MTGQPAILRPEIGKVMSLPPRGLQENPEAPAPAVAAREKEPPPLAHCRDPVEESRRYVSYAWADESDPNRERKVDRLCEAAVARGDKIILDKTATRRGDRISDFMREIGRGDRVFVFLSDKYLKSPFCMFELFEVWRNSRQEAEDLNRRVRLYVLDDAKIWKPIDRLHYAHYWDDEFAALNAALAGKSPTLLGEAAFKRFRHMRDFAHHVSDILALFADTVQPRNFDEFLAYGFDDPVRGPGDEIKMRPPREIARGEANLPPAPPVDVARIDKYAPAELIGREAETAVIEQAWAKACKGEPHPFVLTFVALGGEGKTSLVAKWANDLAARGWPGCEAAFAWSFYSQGTREQAGASSDLFSRRGDQILRRRGDRRRERPREGQAAREDRRRQARAA